MEIFEVKFNTRDSKPKSYDIAILTAVMAILTIAMILLKQALLLSLASAVYLLIVLVLLIRAFFHQLQYNPYSYNTIYYAGFALFAFFVFLTNLYLISMQIRYPELYYNTVYIVSVYLDSAKNYMLISFPFLVIFSIMLCVSNISLIRHEGRSPVNILGIILSILLVGGFLFLFYHNYAFSGSFKEVVIHDLLVNTFAGIYLYFECMMIGTMIADAIVAFHEPEYDKDYMIILGCGLNKDGTPTPLLKGRIDSALAFADRQKEKTGKELSFVTSGGQGADEIVSESEAMKRYLMEQGIPDNRIIKEDQSKNTYENMLFSKEKIMERDPQAKAAFSTTNYHVFRSGLFARMVKMKAEGIGAKTKWYFWPNAAVREFVGLLTQHCGKQLLIICSIVLLYLALTLIKYGFWG